MHLVKTQQKTGTRSRLTSASSKSTGFGRNGSALWERYHDRFLTDSAQHQDLQRLCKAVDELDAIDRQMDHDGLTIVSKSGVLKAHPLLRSKNNLRAYIIRMQKSLGLIKPPHKRPVGRPAAGGIGVFGPGVAEIHRQKYGGGHYDDD